MTESLKIGISVHEANPAGFVEQTSRPETNPRCPDQGPTKYRCFSSGLTTRKRCRLAKRCRLLWTRQDLRVHHVHWMASREGQDLVNCCAQQCLITIPLNVAEMRGAERVCHPNQRVPGAQHRLVLVDVHGRRTRLTLVEGCRQRAALDDLRPAGVDEKRSRLHARQILRRHDAVGLGIEWDVQAEHVCCGEEFFAVWSNLKTRLACPRHRAFPTPAQDTHLKCLPDPRDKAADAAKSIDAECLAHPPGSQRAEPQAGLEPLHLLRNMAQGSKDQPPGEFGGGVG